MDIKLIICDLDRTLRRNDGNIPQYSIDILHKCRDIGILLGFATTRSQLAAQKCIDAVRPDVLALDGGALAKINDEIIYLAKVEASTATSLLDAIKQAPDVGHIIATTPRGYFDGEYFNLSAGAFKIVAQVSESSAKAIVRPFADIGYVPHSDDRWTSFAHIGATKWQAVDAVAAHLGINPAQIAAFGDDFSDVEMLANCGFGVAMGNAIPEAKSAAKYVCIDNEQDGVARWLETNILNERSEADASSGI